MIFIQPNVRSKSATVIALILLCSVLHLPFAYSQKGVTNNGARIVVNTGAVINIKGIATDANFTNKTFNTYHGRIDLDGKIKLQGSWYNNASSADVFINVDADGEVQFNGTTAQSIGGLQTKFEKLTLNNAAGLSLSGDPYVNGILTLTSGIINLYNNNLIIGPSGSISGSFGTTRMIVSNGTGTLRKEFNETGTFTFPIGDVNGTAEYSRAVINLNSGTTVTPPAYISIKVTDDKHPLNGSLSEYLTRYFSVSSSGITTPNLTFYYYYLDSDIAGTETSIYNAKYLESVRTLFSPVTSGSNYAYKAGLTNLGDFTGIDGTSPSVSIASTALNPTNANPISVTFTFSERVSRFALGDITLGNCTAVALSTSDSITFALNVTPTGSAVTVDVSSGVCTDLAGNGNTSATPFSRTYDGTAPSVTLASSVPARTNAAFNVTFTFTENVTGFVSGDITVTNSPTITGFTGSGTTYSATITPNSLGTVSVSVAATKAQDAALNWNTASTNTISTIFDNVKPTVTLSSTSSNPTNLKPFPVRITFSENINEGSLTLEDITVGNGSPSGLTKFNDTNWDVSITPTIDGTVTVDFAVDKITDLAGNTNSVATQLFRTYDGTKPIATITTGATNPTKTSPIPVTITFNEEVNLFAKADLVTLNVNTGSTTMTTSDSIVFTLSVVPSSNGLVTIDIPINVAHDNAGNTNNASTQFSITYDINAPTVSAFNPSDGATGVPLTSNLEIVFNEVVVVGTGNILIKRTSDNATVQTIDVTSLAVTGSGTNTIAINPSDFLSTIGYYVLIDNTAFKDNAGNNFAGISITTVWNFTAIDADSPYILSLSPADNSINVDLNTNLVITFSENIVKGTGDIIIKKSSDNSIVETIAVTSGLVTVSTNTATINPTADLVGETGYYVFIAAGAFTDGVLPFAGISSSATWNFTTKDVAAPLATNYSPANNAVGVSVTSNLVITFSEIVNVNTGSVVIKNISSAIHETIAITSGQITGGGTNTITINPSINFSSKTKYYVEIAAGALRDASNNNYTGITGSATWAFTTADIVAPTVTLSSTAPAIVNGAFTVSIAFSEKITDFSIFDISADNGTKSNFTVVQTDSIFTVQITPVNNGTVSVQVTAGVCQDMAGNLNSASNIITRTYDNIQPTVTIASNKTSPLNSAFTATITFSESVTGFVDGDIIVVNATKSGFSGTGTTYSVLITPTIDGVVTVNIADVAIDAAGNTNIAAEELSVLYDGTDPTLAITSVTPNPTNNSTLNVLFTFSEQVSDFAIGNISVVNGSKVSCTTTDSIVFEVVITATANTSITIGSSAGAATDLAGNDNLVPTSLVILHDGINPTVSLTSAFSPGPIDVSPFELDITFSEKIVDFDFSDLIVSNGVPSNLTTLDSIAYTVDISPSAVGLVTVDINAAAAYDLAGNPSSAATQFNITYEGTSTDVVIAYTGANPTNLTPLPITITFTESVNGFDVTDFVVTNGLVNNLLTSNSKDFTASLVPSATGLVKVKILANAATNSLGNGNNPSNEIEVTFDNTLPTVVIASSLTSPTNNASIPITFTFSESVTGFDMSDVTVSAGSLSGWSVLGNVYSATLTPPGASSTILLSIPAGVALDVVNNPNTASNLFSIVFDNNPPTALSITSIENNPTYNDQFEILITFSEKVVGLTAGEISITNGSAANLATPDSITFTADITASAVSTLTITIPANILTDLAGNLNTALATPFTIVYSGPRPGVTISSVTSSPTISTSITLDIVFTESITGLELIDFTVTGGGAVSNLSGSGSVWTATLTPSADGLVTVKIPENSVTNTNSNGNTVSNTFEITFDNSKPTITITSNPLNYTNVTPIPVTIVFSEIVSGFAIGDLVIGNGSPAGLSTVDNMTFTFNVTPVANGIVTIDIAANALFDLAGNGNDAATQYSVNYDTVIPTVVISSTESSPTSSYAIPITITFSELVTGFDQTDLTINNGTVQNLIQNDNVYSFTLVPGSDGTITVNIAAGRATDLAGNSNTAAVEYSIIVESGPPSVTITSSETNPSNSNNIPVNFTFTEPVTGFESADIVITNATISGTMTNVGNIYSIILNPISDGPITVDVPANVANDLYGNANFAATQYSITYDGTIPSVIIGTTVTSPTNTSPIPLTITFSEAVTNLEISDIIVVNGSITDLSGTGADYTATLSPTDGIVTVNIPSGSAFDLAGNVNTAATELSITYDSAAPTVLITSSVSGLTNNSSIPLTITFSEVVTGFIIDDITVTNGTLTGFIDGGDIYTVTLTPTSSGNVTVNIAANSAQDVVGNGNMIATEFAIVYDGVAPSVMISSTAGPTITNPNFTSTITFTEAVSGFTSTDIAIVNGSLSTLTTTDSIAFNASVTATNQGVVTINIANGVATDLAGNDNVAASEFSITYNPSTGIDDIKKYQVSIYSVQGAIIIEIINPEDITFSKGHVEVFNVIGLPIVNVPLNNFSRSKINVSEASGVYVVKLSLDNDTHMKKVFINK